MAIKKEGYVFIVVLVLFAISVSFLSFSIAYANPFELLVRLFALNGFLTLSIATMMTPFLKEIKTVFNKPFMQVHHSFAAVGMTLITLHPIAYALQTLNPTVFLPNFQSWYLFWSLGGRQALIIAYVAVVAVFVRRKIPKYWRFFHALMYLVLFLAIVHANLLGTDFQNVIVSNIFNALFAVSLMTFGLKRLQLYRIKRMRSSRTPPQ